MIYSSPWIKLILLLAIKMVLCGAVAGAGDLMANVSRFMTEEELDAHVQPPATWRRLYVREMQTILRHEGARTREGEGVECCPSVLEMVEKKGGRTPSGLYVELYEDGDNKQRFYELSCAKGVVGKPCRFLDPRLYNQSRCVQKYSYSYALVRCSDSTGVHDRHSRTEGNFPVPGSGGCSMDYVMVRAGCECQITPPKHKNPHRRHKQKRRNRRLGIEDAET